MDSPPRLGELYLKSEERDEFCPVYHTLLEVVAVVDYGSDMDIYVHCVVTTNLDPKPILFTYPAKRIRDEFVLKGEIQQIIESEVISDGIDVDSIEAG